MRHRATKDCYVELRNWTLKIFSQDFFYEFIPIQHEIFILSTINIRICDPKYKISFMEEDKTENWTHKLEYAELIHENFNFDSFYELMKNSL